jgi:hypothetical protein
MSGANNDIMHAMQHVVGRGIAPAPVTGAGLWDNLKGFAKNVYHFTAPHLKKAATGFARDVVGGLNKELNADKRMLEI